MVDINAGMYGPEECLYTNTETAESRVQQRDKLTFLRSRYTLPSMMTLAGVGLLAHLYAAQPNTELNFGPHQIPLEDEKGVELVVKVPQACDEPVSYYIKGKILPPGELTMSQVAQMLKHSYNRNQTYSSNERRLAKGIAPCLEEKLL